MKTCESPSKLKKSMDLRMCFGFIFQRPLVNWYLSFLILHFMSSRTFFFPLNIMFLKFLKVVGYCCEALVLSYLFHLFYSILGMYDSLLIHFLVSGYLD